MLGWARAAEADGVNRIGGGYGLGWMGGCVRLCVRVLVRGVGVCVVRMQTDEGAGEKGRSSQRRGGGYVMPCPARVPWPACLFRPYAACDAGACACERASVRGVR